MELPPHEQARLQAAADIRAELNSVTKDGREPDDWERVCLIRAIMCLNWAMLDAVAEYLHKLRTEPSHRSPGWPQTVTSYERRLSVEQIDEFLRIATNSPQRRPLP